MDRTRTRWLRIGLVVGVAVAVVAPTAVWASDRFLDVPDSNIFHDDIAWLAEADVTRGCNPPDNDEFCPAENVTRQQMAAFMRRLATNRVVDAASAETAESATTAETAEDAQALEGFTAEELAPRASVTSEDDIQEGGTAVVNLDTTIEAPAPGVLLMDAAVDVADLGAADADVVCSLSVNDAEVQGTSMSVSVQGLEGIDEAICSTTGAIQVAAGEHTVTFTIEEFGLAELLAGNVNAMWVPLTGSGAQP